MDNKLHLRFIVPIRPISLNRMYRVFRGRSIKSAEAREFELVFNSYLVEFAQHAKIFLENFDPSLHAIHLQLRFFTKDFTNKSGSINLTKGDLDNYNKVTIDQVFRFLSLNDALVTNIHSTKLASNVDATEIILKRVYQIHKKIDPIASGSYSADLN
jgi:Holliday junction resolvase RusA-like endonuclease